MIVCANKRRGDADEKQQSHNTLQHLHCDGDVVHFGTAAVKWFLTTSVNECAGGRSGDGAVDVIVVFNRFEMRGDLGGNPDCRRHPFLQFRRQTWAVPTGVAYGNSR